MHPELDTFVLSVAESSGVHERCVFEVWRNEKIWNPIFSRSDGGHTPSKTGGGKSHYVHIFVKVW